MQLIRGLHNIQAQQKNCVATIGNFDGVHLGHQLIIKQLQQRAKEMQVNNCVITFEPLPREFFSDTKYHTRLSSLREKKQQMTACGVDQLLCLAFNRSLASLTADQFIQQVLVHGLQVRHVLIGDDFHFGCDRSGNREMLSKAGKISGFTVEQTDTHRIKDKRISSTEVRQLLSTGNCREVADLLGRNYSLTGRVIAGQGIGRKHLVATANLLCGKNRTLPVRGVYAVKVKITDIPSYADRFFPAVANIGTRPTICPGHTSIEVHLLDFNQDLYGHFLQVEFIDKLRDEKHFSSVEALGSAIRTDISRAGAVLSREQSKSPLM